MRKLTDILALGWVQLLLFLAAVGGIPGLITLWDRLHQPPPIVITTSPGKTPPAATGSIDKKSSRLKALEKSFWDDPWDWLSRHGSDPTRNDETWPPHGP